MIVDRFVIVLIVIILYVLILFLAKVRGIGKRIKCKNSNNCCPDCKSPLIRVHRKNTDHFLEYISFQIFNFKRYICKKCGWQGLRWEEKFQQNRN